MDDAVQGGTGARDFPPIEAETPTSDVTSRVHREELLRQSEARLELATRASGLGIWDWRLDTGEIIFSTRARAIWGFPAEGPVTQGMMAAAIFPADAEQTDERFRRATDPELRERHVYEYRVTRPDGAVRWVRAHAEAVFEPRDGHEVAVRYAGTMADVTDELAREAALRSSEVRLKLAIDAGRMAIWSVGADGSVDATREFNRLLGLPEDAAPTLEELQARYHPGELERLQKLGEETQGRGERYIEFEYRHLWPDDSARWMLVRAEFLEIDGEPAGAIGVIMDITERRESEERLRLLAREVDHRANNLLAVVQGAIRLTSGASVEEFKESLLGRVAALANAHQLLAASRWLGADLRRLVEEELRPYASKDEVRVRIDGSPYELGPEMAQAVAMVVHELATNALKHGAFSRPGGWVEVSWETVPGSPPAITWREYGGPPVTTPSRVGMGSRVLDRALGGPAGGRTEVDWLPEGITCRIYLGREPEPAQTYASS